MSCLIASSHVSILLRCSQIIFFLGWFMWFCSSCCFKKPMPYCLGWVVSFQFYLFLWRCKEYLSLLKICHVLYSCMRKKLVTEPRRVPIKILGICFTFWPVPKNYQKKIKIIKLYFIKKNNKKQVGWISVNIMMIMDLLLVMVSGFLRLHLLNLTAEPSQLCDSLLFLALRGCIPIKLLIGCVCAL